MPIEIMATQVQQQLMRLSLQEDRQAAGARKTRKLEVFRYWKKLDWVCLIDS